MNEEMLLENGQMTYMIELHPWEGYRGREWKGDTKIQVERSLEMSVLGQKRRGEIMAVDGG